MGAAADTLRRAEAAFRRGDRNALIACLHPDVVWHPLLGPLLGERSYRGPEAVASLVLDEIPATIEGFTSELAEVIERDDSTVIALGKFSGRAASVDLSFDYGFAQVWRFRDGLVVEMRPYPDLEAALEATDTG